MNKIVPLLLAAALTACGKAEQNETVESLAANPEPAWRFRADAGGHRQSCTRPCRF